MCPESGYPKVISEKKHEPYHVLRRAGSNGGHSLEYWRMSSLATETIFTEFLRDFAGTSKVTMNERITSAFA